MNATGVYRVVTARHSGSGTALSVTVFRKRNRIDGRYHFAITNLVAVVIVVKECVEGCSATTPIIASSNLSITKF